MSIEKLIELARSKLSPEDVRLRALEAKARMLQYERERVKRDTCSECGVDTGKYSHTFRCYWRGIC
jgi:hypothetical protein